MYKLSCLASSFSIGNSRFVFERTLEKSSEGSKAQLENESDRQKAGNTHIEGASSALEMAERLKIQGDIIAVTKAIHIEGIDPYEGETEAAFWKRHRAHEEKLRAEGKMTHSEKVFKRFELIAQLITVDKEFAREQYPIEYDKITSGIVEKMKRNQARREKKEKK